MSSTGVIYSSQAGLKAIVARQSHRSGRSCNKIPVTKELLTLTSVVQRSICWARDWRRVGGAWVSCDKEETLWFLINFLYSKYR